MCCNSNPGIQKTLCSKHIICIKIKLIEVEYNSYSITNNKLTDNYTKTRLEVQLMQESIVRDAIQNATTKQEARWNITEGWPDRDTKSFVVLFASFLRRQEPSLPCSDVRKEVFGWSYLQPVAGGRRNEDTPPLLSSLLFLFALFSLLFAWAGRDRRVKLSPWFVGGYNAASLLLSFN